MMLHLLTFKMNYNIDSFHLIYEDFIPKHKHKKMKKNLYSKSLCQRYFSNRKIINLMKECNLHFHLDLILNFYPSLNESDDMIHSFINNDLNNHKYIVVSNDSDSFPATTFNNFYLYLFNEMHQKYMLYMFNVKNYNIKFNLNQRQKYIFHTLCGTEMIQPILFMPFQFQSNFIFKLFQDKNISSAIKFLNELEKHQIYLEEHGQAEAKKGYFKTFTSSLTDTFDILKFFQYKIDFIHAILYSFHRYKYNIEMNDKYFIINFIKNKNQLFSLEDWDYISKFYLNTSLNECEYVKNDIYTTKLCNNAYDLILHHNYIRIAENDIIKDNFIQHYYHERYNSDDLINKEELFANQQDLVHDTLHINEKKQNDLLDKEELPIKESYLILE